MACFGKKYVFLELLNRSNMMGNSLFNKIITNARHNLKNSAVSYCVQPQEQNLLKKLGSGSNKISQAMKNYLIRVKEHEIFMGQQMKEYEEGKKYLAKMMGKNPENFSQKNIDDAIAYLLPSALFIKEARPILAHPQELFKKQKEAQFDASGRPHHYLFYTTKPNYFQTMHECGKYNEILNRKIIKMDPQSIDPKVLLNLTATRWKDKAEIEEIFIEKLLDVEYEKLIIALEKLLKNPYSYECAEFILGFRKSVIENIQKTIVKKPTELKEGVFALTSKRCRRKNCYGDITIISPGTGNITINNKELIDFFESIQSREQVLFPLLFTGMLGKVDVRATVGESGPSAQAGVIRYGISKSLVSFVSPEMILKMKVAGLLTCDPRRRERKKPGRRRARARYTWLKR